MPFGPEDSLYVSVRGVLSSAGSGEVVRYDGLPSPP
jgi:hypothetical protein